MLTPAKSRDRSILAYAVTDLASLLSTTPAMSTGRSLFTNILRRMAHPQPIKNIDSEATAPTALFKSTPVASVATNRRTGRRGSYTPYNRKVIEKHKRSPDGTSISNYRTKATSKLSEYYCPTRGRGSVRTPETKSVMVVASGPLWNGLLGLRIRRGSAAATLQ